MFKKILTPFLILITTGLLWSQQSASIEWVSMQDALDMKKKSKKIIFVDVYTSWCGWCKRMDQTTFQDKNVVEMLNKHFIPVKFNAEGSDVIKLNGKEYKNPIPGRTRSTHEFTYELLGQRFGYPSFSFLDEDNNVIGMLQGYQQAGQLIDVLTYFQTKAYLTQNYDDWARDKKAE
jgi:thioredoxin-related protein